jgi:tetratricopeptide (TPR) repeat protein
MSPASVARHCKPALELGPFLPEANFSRAAFATWQRFDWDEARLNFERAIELNPGYAQAPMFFAHFLGIVGEFERSTEHMETAVQPDPLNPFPNGDLQRPRFQASLSKMGLDYWAAKP